MGDQADKFTQLQGTGGNLDESHEDHRGKEIIQPHAFHGHGTGHPQGLALFHQGNHDHGQGTGGTGDHPGPPAKEGGHQPHHKCGIEPHQGIHPGHKGKCHGLGDQGQGHGDPGNDVVLGILGSGSNQFKHKYFALFTQKRPPPVSGSRPGNYYYKCSGKKP